MGNRRPKATGRIIDQQFGQHKYDRAGSTLAESDLDPGSDDRFVGQLVALARPTDWEIGLFELACNNQRPSCHTDTIPGSSIVGDWGSQSTYGQLACTITITLTITILPRIWARSTSFDSA